MKPKHVGSKFGDKMESLREMHGESQQRLADIIGEGQTTVSRWEREQDRYKPNIWQALAVAKHYRVPLEWLVDESLPWPPPIGVGEDEKMVYDLIQIVGVKEAKRRLAQAPPEADVKFRSQPPGPPQSRDEDEPPAPKRRRRRGGA